MYRVITVLARFRRSSSASRSARRLPSPWNSASAFVARPSCFAYLFFAVVLRFGAICRERAAFQSWVLLSWVLRVAFQCTRSGGQHLLIRAAFRWAWSAGSQGSGRSPAPDVPLSTELLGAPSDPRAMEEEGGRTGRESTRSPSVLGLSFFGSPRKILPGCFVSAHNPGQRSAPRCRLVRTAVDGVNRNLDRTVAFSLDTRYRRYRVTDKIRRSCGRQWSGTSSG